MTSTADYKITEATPGEVIKGLTVSALASLPAGMLVRRKDPAAGAASIFDDSVQLELCNGFGPVAILERPTLAVGATIPLDQLYFGTDILCPTIIGAQASARVVKSIEVEGSDLIQTTGGQGLSGSTAVGSELTSLAGKWALRTHTSSQELCGILRAQLSPVNSGNFRLWIQIKNAGTDSAVAS